MSLTINGEFLNREEYAFSQEIVKTDCCNKVLENLNQANFETYRVQCKLFNKLYPLQLKILKALKNFNGIPYHSLTVNHFYKILTTVGKLEDLLLRVNNISLLTQHFLDQSTHFQIKQVTFHVIEKKLYWLRNLQYPPNILTYRKEVASFEKIILKQGRFVQMLNLRLKKAAKSIHVHTQIFLRRLEYCSSLPFSSAPPRVLAPSSSSSNRNVYSKSSSNFLNNRPIVINENISILLLENESESISFPYKHLDKALNNYRHKKFAYCVFNYLHRQDCDKIQRINSMFKLYHAAIKTADIMLNILVTCIREKNVIFETSRKNCQIALAATLSDHYVKSFWNYIYYGFEVATSMHFFSHQVSNFKPTSLPLPVFRGALNNFVQRHEKVTIYKKEIAAYQKMKKEEYKFLMGLNDKIATRGMAFEAALLEAVDQLGRYEQTIANDNQPLSPILHAFSRYHIRIPDEDEKKNASTRDKKDRD